MLLECNRCGAPLDVGDRTRVVKCKYCSASNDVGRLKTIAPRTPPDWRPPPTWTPPAHMPAPSDVPLTYHPGGARLGLAITLGSMMVALTGGIVAAVSGTRGHTSASGGSFSTGLDPKQLSTVTLREPKSFFLGLPGASASGDDSVRVPLAGGDWDAVAFEWDPAHPEHVLDFHVNCPSPHPAYARVKANLDKLLPKRWTGESWRWEGASIYYASTGGVLSVSIGKEKDSGDRENRAWKEQVEALWDVVRSAALGLPITPDAARVRDYLGGGQPLAKLLEIDDQATIEASEAAVKRVFPGAAKAKHISLSYTLALDHPWIGQAELEWENKEGSKLKEIDFRSPTNKLEHQDDFVACATSGLGIQGKDNVSDYLNKQHDVIFRPKEGGELRIYGHMMVIHLRDYPFAKPMPRATFDKMIRMIDACGRK